MYTVISIELVCIQNFEILNQIMRSQEIVLENITNSLSESCFYVSQL